MSSEHYIIIARNDETGALELPLGDMTLYGSGKDPETGEYEEENLVRSCAERYDENWTVCLYGRIGGAYGGTKKPVDRRQRLRDLRETAGSMDAAKKILKREEMLASIDAAKTIDDVKAILRALIG